MTFIQTYAIYIAFISAISLIGLSIGIIALIDGNIKSGLAILLIAFLICFGIGYYGYWRINYTAEGVRHKKDIQSSVENGIDREITITAEDGRVIFHYEGKIDIETDHTDNYIKFESEEGKRHIIYYGITDTVLIIEK